jgi:hypothetical protein
LSSFDNLENTTGHRPEAIPAKPLFSIGRFGQQLLKSQSAISVYRDQSRRDG